MGESDKQIVKNKKIDKVVFKQTITGYLLMMLGCLSYAVGLSWFIADCEIVAGGISGLSTLFHILFPKIGIGVFTVALNIPIFIMGFKMQGFRFIFRALVTVATLGLFIDLVDLVKIRLTDDPLLSCLYGAVLEGIGIGLFIRTAFSSGGTELLGRIFSNWFKIGNIPLCSGILDFIIVISGAIVLKSTTNVLYAIIVVFVSTKVGEVVLLGLGKSKLCFIITDKGEEVGKAIMEYLPRGVTKLEGEGMYTHKNHNVLMTCVKNRQLVVLRKIVKEVDPEAFVIVNESVEVRGKGFSNWNQT